jgi:hypothetical protein
LELGDLAIHQEEAYPDETLVAGRVGQTGRVGQKS